MQRRIRFITCFLAIITLAMLVVIGCSDDDIDPVNPLTLTTLAVTDITKTSAKSGGNITDDGGGEISTRGVVWSTGESPTLENHSGIAVDTTGSAIFQSKLTDLSPATAYYVRAYATNSAGTSYGNDVMFETITADYLLALNVEPSEAGDVTGAGEYQEGEQVNITATDNEGWEFLEWRGDTLYVNDPDSENTTVTMPAQDISITAFFSESNLVDIDGNIYQTVVIGDQEWMAENLRVTRYNNGDTIPTGLSDEEWSNTTDGAYAIFDHNHSDADGISTSEEMVAAYGKLYNWYAVADPKGLCPEGWHVPIDYDWTRLQNYIMDEYDFTGSIGNSLKSCRQVDSPLGGDCDTNEHPRWNSDETHHGFDEFGFLALPGGRKGVSGVFNLIGGSGFWWTSTEHSPSNAGNRTIRAADGGIWQSAINKRFGISVRCVREIDN